MGKKEDRRGRHIKEEDRSGGQVSVLSMQDIRILYDTGNAMVHNVEALRLIWRGMKRIGELEETSKAPIKPPEKKSTEAPRKKQSKLTPRERSLFQWQRSEEEIWQVEDNVPTDLPQSPEPNSMDMSTKAPTLFHLPAVKTRTRKEGRFSILHVLCRSSSIPGLCSAKRKRGTCALQ